MRSVTIKVNEKEIPLNELMEIMLINIILGYLRSAKKVPEDIHSIKIDIAL